MQQCYSKSKSIKSRRAGELALNTFSKYLKENYSDISEETIISDLKTIQHDRENYAKLYHFLNKFVQYLIQKGNSSRTIQLYLAMLKSFFRFNGIRIYSEDSKQFINIPKINKERKVPITHEMLSLLLKQCNVQYKAFILFLTSSGMRVGEGLGVLVKDVDFGMIPPMIHVRAEIAKTREERITFMSTQTYDILKPMLAKRKPDDYLFFPHRTDDALNRVEKAFSKIRERAGLVSKYQSGWYHVHIHGLRAFFISQCERVHEGFGHALAGHGKYMKEYENYSDAELKEFYGKIELALGLSL